MMLMRILMYIHHAYDNYNRDDDAYDGDDAYDDDDDDTRDDDDAYEDDDNDGYNK